MSAEELAARVAPRCPDCDCPNRHCACVLRSRMEGADKRYHDEARRAAEYRELWSAAASCLAHNRTRLARPRGADERRLLTFIDRGGAAELGHFWSGKTDGWLDWLPDGQPGAEPPERNQEVDG